VDSSARFRIRFGIFRWLLFLLLMGPRFSYVELKEGAIRVAMGWAFQSTIPRSSVTRAYRDRNMWGGIGVPVRLRKLHVSLEDPDAFVAAVGSG
jgi:hypothetical protein